MKKIWSNTATLDDYKDGLEFTSDKTEAEVVLMGSKKIELSEFPNLKGLFRAGVGRDNVPVAEAESKGIAVCFPSERTTNVIYQETANFACYLIMRMMYENTGELASWTKFDRPALQEKTLLVIGTGKIGSLVSKQMSVLMNVLEYDVLKNSEAELMQMIKVADCITLHIPFTDENKGFFDKSKFALMKQDAVLVNTARGPIVHEDDLYDFIKSGKIRAAFDVFWEEPYKGKLTEFYPDRFFMTPHIASTCSSFLKNCADDLREFTNQLAA